MNILIRPAILSDANTICTFQLSMAQETENLSLDKLLVANGVRAVFEDHDKGQYYVAESKGKVIGSCLITYEWSDWRNGYIYWLQSVFVLHEYRNKGVFKAMYSYIKEQVLNDNSLKGLRLYVETNNKKAQKVYEKVGMDGARYLTYEWMKQQ